MKIQKHLLLQHLSNIYCSKQIPDCLFFGTFKTRALNSDKGIIVLSHGHSSLPLLHEDVGVLDLKILISAVTKIKDDELTIEFKDNKLICYTEQISFNLLTCLPQYVTTNNNKNVIDKVIAFVDNNTANKLQVTNNMVSMFNDAHSVINSETAKFILKGSSGLIELGGSGQNEASISVNLEDHHDGSLEYTVFSETMSAILSRTVGGYIYATKTQSPLKIVSECGNYEYYVSPVK